MWSEENDDGRRRRELLISSGENNPFTPVINRFYGFNKEFSAADLDEIHTALATLPELTALYDTLATEQPRFTGIFRFDPFSINFTGQEGCFSSRISDGASMAYGRIFEGLTLDKIQIIQTADEVMVAAVHPSYLISSKEPPKLVEEPTVLFTSRMFQLSSLGYEDNEEYQLGMVIKHGESPFEVRPLPTLSTTGMEMQYLRYAMEFAKGVPH